MGVDQVLPSVVVAVPLMHSTVVVAVPLVHSTVTTLHYHSRQSRTIFQSLHL
jgi:hypothetical protein